MGIKVRVRVRVRANPNPNPNANEMQMRSAEGINSSTASIPDWNKLSWRLLPIYFCPSFTFSFLFFFFPGLFSAASLSTVGSLEHLAPVTQPHGEGRVTLLHRQYQSSCLVLPRSAVSRPGGTLALVQILPEEKQPSPERVARKPRKGRAGSSLSGWPQVPSGVPAVLFPFSREALPVPPQSTSGFPLPE